MKLLIVESPGKIQKIQKIVGDDYIVKASVGHITELAKTGDANTGVDIKNNFKPKYIVSKDKMNVLSDLINTATTCEMIYLCTDPDREGESISWHLKERLSTLDIPFKRASFKELTKKAILKALNDAGDIDYKLVESQEARRILDRIVGFKVSPFLMKSYNETLSAGRVQSVATKLICEREQEIKAFTPEEFFNLYANLKHTQKDFVVKLDKRFKTKKEADDCANVIVQSKKIIVESVESEQKKEKPQPPLVTATLQQVMSKKFGYSADKTMAAAQRLYEKGAITYLRTDSVRAEPEATKSLRDWLDTNNHAKSPKENVFKNKDASQDAHECIRPTDMDTLCDNGFLFVNDEEKNTYDMIWKYFAASQMTDAIYNTLKITLSLQSDPSLKFKVSGKALFDQGYLKIFNESQTSSIDIPNVQQGDLFDINDSKQVKVEQKKTQAPPRYAEDVLIKELVSKEIGRPATYAQILTTISSRNYVEKKGNTYYGTEKGIEVTQKLNKYFRFMDYKFTADMEKNLDDIAHNKVEKNKMLKEFYENLTIDLAAAYKDANISLCPDCSNPLVDRTNKKTGEAFKGCSGYPKCNFVLRS